jgi:hypothetical protein
MRRSALVLVAAFLVVAAVLESGFAEARAEGTSDYSKTQTFTGALRYVRVDLGYDVIEKDLDAGYLMFRYEPPGRRGRPTHGSVEIVEAKGRVMLYVKLPQMPSYHEVVLRDGLLKKLREEYGDPPRPRPAPAAPKRPADAGAG